MGGRPLKVLADTHTLVWALSAPHSLSTLARNVVTTSEVIVSVASLWELILKAGRKDALLVDPVPWWEKYVEGRGIATLSIRTRHVIALGSLPEIHRDPFDRILIAQSRTEKMPLVSKDMQLANYGIEVIW